MESPTIAWISSRPSAACVRAACNRAKAACNRAKAACRDSDRLSAGVDAGAAWKRCGGERCAYFAEAFGLRRVKSPHYRLSATPETVLAALQEQATEGLSRLTHSVAALLVWGRPAERAGAALERVLDDEDRRGGASRFECAVGEKSECGGITRCEAEADSGR